MGERIQVPTVQELSGQGLLAELGDEPWIATVTVWAQDGDVVEITWDEVAATVTIRWMRDGRQVADLHRDLVTMVSLVKNSSHTEVRVLSGNEDIKGRLMLVIGAHVQWQDFCLR